MTKSNRVGSRLRTPVRSPAQSARPRAHCHRLLLAKPCSRRSVTARRTGLTAQALANRKPETPLRSSDRRALVSEVETTFGVSSDVAKALVPDGLLSCKAATHLDAPVVLYSHGGDALWVRSGRDARDDDAVLFPTLYTLARCPTLLPIIGTAPPVIAKLTTGADLMAPGVSMAMLADLPDLPAATLVAVASVDEAAVPKAVGQLAVSKRELAGHGKAVVTLHAIGDHLWLAGSQESAQPLDGSSRAASGQATPAKDAEMPDVGALVVDDAPVASSSSSAPLPAKGPPPLGDAD